MAVQDNYEGNSGFFTFTLSGVKKDVCDKVLSEGVPFAAQMKLGTNIIAENAECEEGENNTMVFAFSNDLASILPIMEAEVSGGFSSTTPGMMTPEMTRISTTPGMNQYETTRKTCPSDRPLHGSDDWCYFCDDSSPVYVGSDGECSEKCPDRVKMGSYCAKPCSSSQFMNNTGNCYSCDNTGTYIRTSSAECAKCGDKRYMSGYYCKKK